MIKRILKYSLRPGYNQLKLSKGYKILAVGIQQNQPQIWIEIPQITIPPTDKQWGKVADEPETEEVHLNCQFTGDWFECKPDDIFIGTAISDWLVVHIYQTPN